MYINKATVWINTGLMKKLNSTHDVDGYLISEMLVDSKGASQEF